MNYDERANLINSLSEAVNKRTGNEGNKVKRFNPSTGTIYCNNDVEYDKTSIIEARKKLEDRRAIYERNGDAEGIRLCDISSALMELYLNEIDENQKNK